MPFVLLQFVPIIILLCVLFISQSDHQSIDTVDATENTWINKNGNISNITTTNSQPRLSIASSKMKTNNNNSNSTSLSSPSPAIKSSNNNEETDSNVTANEASDSYFDFDMEPESPGSPIDECEYTRLIDTAVSTPQGSQAPESGFVCASPCSTIEGESRGSASSSEGQFFDPESSDTATEFFDCVTDFGRHHHRRYHHLNHNRVAIRPSSPVLASESSSESTSTATSRVNGHVRLIDQSSICDSSESLPPSQSTNSSMETASKLADTNSNSNSTLQDAEGEIVDDEEVAVEVEPTKAEEDEQPQNCIEHTKTKFIRYESPVASPDKEASPELEEEVPFSQAKVLEEIQTNGTATDEEQNVANETVATVNNKTDSDDSGEDERPMRVRRCSSLKTGKTPPGTPGRKKIVRFADVLGLDLADVRTFLDEVPKIPKSAYEDLDVTLLPSQQAIIPSPIDKVLVPLFQQPGCLPGFVERLKDCQVCLESATVTDPVNLTITGIVRVRNLDFHKSVHVRFSTDSWRTFSDMTANYVENSCDGFSDKFSFMLFGNSFQVGQRLELALRFSAKGEQFWDNNYGANYSFQCLPCSARPSPIIPAAEVGLDEGLLSSSPSILSSHIDVMGSRQWSNTFLY